MTPSGKPERVQAQVGLYFAERPPSRHPCLVRLGSYALHIPAGSTHYNVRDEYTLPVDVEVLGVSPHAHYLARTIEATAVTPSGQQIPLLQINRWNFNWQGAYRHAQPVHLERGSQLRVSFIFDNSAENPQNPHRPPQAVLYGPRTADEMADLWVLVVPRDEADSQRLRQDLSLCELSRRIDGYTNVILHHPDRANQALAYDAIGTIFLAKGSLRDATQHFEQALELDDQCVSAHFHLGCVLKQSEQYENARFHLLSVLQVNPNHAVSHCLLGQMAEAQRQYAIAIRHYQAAIALDEELVTAGERLGYLLALPRELE